jgi:patatin-like phospholipase/acyl hydrolase
MAARSEPRPPKITKSHLAASAAPTYFPAHGIPWHGTYIDGGVWANAPVMVGVTEALDFLKQKPKEIRLLSISTTNYPFILAEKFVPYPG